MYNNQSLISFIKENGYKRVCVLAIASMRSHANKDAYSANIYDLNKDGNFQYWKYQTAALPEVRFEIACPAYKEAPVGFSSNVTFHVFPDLYEKNAADTRATISEKARAVHVLFDSEYGTNTLYVSEFETVKADVYKLNFQKHLSDAKYSKAIHERLSLGCDIFLHNEPTDWYDSLKRLTTSLPGLIHVDKQVVNLEVFFKESEQYIDNITKYLFFPFRLNEPSYRFEDIVSNCKPISNFMFKFNDKNYHKLLLTNPNDFDINCLSDMAKVKTSKIPFEIVKMDRASLFSFLANEDFDIYIAQHPDKEFHQLAIEASILASDRTYFDVNGQWVKDGNNVANAYSY